MTPPPIARAAWAPPGAWAVRPLSAPWADAPGPAVTKSAVTTTVTAWRRSTGPPTFDSPTLRTHRRQTSTLEVSKHPDGAVSVAACLCRPGSEDAQAIFGFCEWTRATLSGEPSGLRGRAPIQRRIGTFMRSPKTRSCDVRRTRLKTTTRPWPARPRTSPSSGSRTRSRITRPAPRSRHRRLRHPSGGTRGRRVRPTRRRARSGPRTDTTTGVSAGSFARSAMRRRAVIACPRHPVGSETPRPGQAASLTGKASEGPHRPL